MNKSLFESPEMAKLAASLLGHRGGLIKSARKLKTSRINGKLGGRPVGAKDKAPRRRRLAVAA